VSVIDQRPIQPSYLELVSLKNFAKKEQEAQRAQFKESHKQENTEQKQAGLNQIDWCKAL
jgi:alpha-D-ribose 1-methylphosphonate 5-triphosphate diphosphatase PhnM